MSLFITKLLFWVILVYGTTQLIVESVIFRPIRDRLKSRSKFWDGLLACMLCTGTWVSGIASMLIWSPSSIVFSSDIMPGTFGIVNDGSFWGYVATGLVQLFGIGRFIIFALMDAIIGGSLIWFLHLIDRRLSCPCGRREPTN